MPDLEGIKVTVGGREWVVPSLTYGEKRQLQARGAFTAKDFNFAALADDDALVALTALRHNYPDLGDDALDALTPVQVGELSRAAIYATIGLKEMPVPGASSPKAEPAGATTSTTSPS